MAPMASTVVHATPNSPDPQLSFQSNVAGLYTPKERFSFKHAPFISTLRTDIAARRPSRPLTSSRKPHARYRPPVSQHHSPAFGPPKDALVHDALPITTIKNSTVRTPSQLLPAIHSSGFWLGLYFLFNLSLTLYNKGILISFPFPYALTAVHALCGTIGGQILVKTGLHTPAPLNAAQYRVLGLFSVLYAVNIVVSNISLGLVSVPVHQVIRASTPVFVLILSAILFGSQGSRAKVASLIPVIAGVGLATYGDYRYSTLGFSLTLLGTFLAALKTIITNLLQTQSPVDNYLSQATVKSPPLPSRRIYLRPQSLLGNLLSIGRRVQLHPLDLIIRMSPFAFVQCLVYSCLTGEMDRVQDFVSTTMTRSQALALLFNGIVAFGLNVVSFTANKKAGALSMAVSANVKQVLTILLAIIIFELHITWINAAGIMLTLAGGAWYGFVEYSEKHR
ncbi:triose-phosphate transporter family-domain-containing protein [Pterulicium gracile]|uniref:Triose-phosphate transporter family-domain-containing protein n=1 Tax=Pterulicium gracile TaxID=1884261 RepID=A0A5C3QQ67_9AGAR|nr:triose-phosphate transporter family-domain-containing protein [Pterula gracilis]